MPPACQRFSGGANRLHHIALQHRLAPQDHAHHHHGDDRGRDRRGNGHTDPEAEVRVRRAENDGQQGSHDD